MRTLIAYTDGRAFGGAEQAMLRLLSGMDRRLWRCLLAHHTTDGLAPLLDGAQRAGIALWPVQKMPPGRLGIVSTLRFAGALRALKPDVFHAHLTWQHGCRNALIAAALAGVPARIATLQLVVEQPFTQHDARKMRWVSRTVDGFIAVSGAIAGHLHHAYDIPLQRIHVIHNAVALPTAPTTPALLPDAVHHDDRLVLTVARLEAQKGLHVLIDAAALAPTAQFVIAGKGHDRPTLEAHVQRLGLAQRVHLLGFRADIAALLARCDVFVLPSFYEGLPIALLEAMAAAKPVISTRVEGNTEVVTHGVDGLLVPPGDARALAGAINTLLSDETLARKLAQNGRRRIESAFTEPAMIARVVRVYEDVLATAGKPHIAQDVQRPSTTHD